MEQTTQEYIDELIQEIKRLKVKNYTDKHNIDDMDKFLEMSDMWRSIFKNSILGGTP
jgi:dsDNA-binding SOS-regulon protein